MVLHGVVVTQRFVFEILFFCIQYAMRGHRILEQDRARCNRVWEEDPGITGTIWRFNRKHPLPHLSLQFKRLLGLVN